MIILDTLHTPYESHNGITLHTGLINSDETTLAVCATTSWSSCNTSTGKETENYKLEIVSISDAEGSSAGNSSGSIDKFPITFDQKIIQKVTSITGLTAGQGFFVSAVLQCREDYGENVLVITDSNAIKDVLNREGISSITYEESGIPYGWTCYRENI